MVEVISYFASNIAHEAWPYLGAGNSIYNSIQQCGRYLFYNLQLFLHLLLPLLLLFLLDFLNSSVSSIFMQVEVFSRSGRSLGTFSISEETKVREFKKDFFKKSEI